MPADDAKNISNRVDEKDNVHVLSPDELYALLKDISYFRTDAQKALKNIEIWINLTKDYLSDKYTRDPDIEKEIIRIQEETLPVFRKIGIELPLQGQRPYLLALTEQMISNIYRDFSRASHDEMYIEHFVINPIHDAITYALENDVLSIEKEINALEKDKMKLKNKMATRIFEDSAISEKKCLTDAKQEYKNKYGHDAEYSPYLQPLIQCIKARTPLEVILEWYNYDKNGGAQNKIMPDAPHHNEAREGLKKIRASTKESKKNRIGSEGDLRMLYNCAFAICALDLKQKEALKYAETDAKKHDQRIAPTYRAVQRKEKMISERDNLKRVTQSDLSAINKYF